MDDNTIFNNQQQPGTTNNPDLNKPKITTQDLYGPSTPAEQQSQTLQTNQTNPQAPLTEQPQQASQPQINDIAQQTEITPQQSQQQPQQFEQPYPTMQNGQTDYAQAVDNSPINKVLGILGNKKVIIAGSLIILIFFIIGLISLLTKSNKGGAAYNNATIVYWGLWEDKNSMQTIINDFEKKYPGIKVNYIKRDPQKYKERLLTRIKNNSEAPDIFTFHNTWVPTLTNSSDNILLPITKDVVTPEEFEKTYYPVVQADMIKKGAIYGLPQGIDTLALFVNKEIFNSAQAKVPQTWEDFNQVSRELTVIGDDGKIRTSGAALGVYDNVTHASDILSLLFLTNGVDLSKIEDQKEEIKQAMMFYISYSGSNKESVWSQTMGQSRDIFASGNLAMYFGYSWDIFAIKAANDKLDFEVQQVPYLPSGQNVKRVTVASYWANGISNKSKHQKEALLFLKYLSQKDVIQKLFSESSKSRQFGMPYARKDLAATLSDNKLIYPFVQQAEYATSSYFVSDTQDSLYNDPLNEYLGNAVRQLKSSGSFDSAFGPFIQGITQVRGNTLR